MSANEDISIDNQICKEKEPTALEILSVSFYLH